MTVVLTLPYNPTDITGNLTLYNLIKQGIATAAGVQPSAVVLNVTSGRRRLLASTVTATVYAADSNAAGNVASNLNNLNTLKEAFSALSLAAPTASKVTFNRAGRLAAAGGLQLTALAGLVLALVGRVR